MKIIRKILLLISAVIALLNVCAGYKCLLMGFNIPLSVAVVIANAVYLLVFIYANLPADNNN